MVRSRVGRWRYGDNSIDHIYIFHSFEILVKVFGIAIRVFGSGWVFKDMFSCTTSIWVLVSWNGV